jgi:hypothetical protein
MATQGWKIDITVPNAGEDLDGVNQQYVAIALDDAKVANNAQEAIGVLQNKPKTGEDIQVTFIGETFFRAGAAIAKGAAVTVTTSGYHITATSGDSVAGQTKASVTSGSVGTMVVGGYAAAQNQADYFTFEVTAADAIPAGRAYAINDNKLANADTECDGIAVTAIASGDTGRIMVGGIVTAATLANSYGPSHRVMATTSGYLTTVVSGFVPNAVVLTGATSGENATVMFFGGGNAVLS